MVDPKELSVFDTRRYPVRPHVGVGILLIRNRKLLLVKRKYDPDAGYWSIPGGHVELGEKTKRAAEREGFEETGFKVKVVKLAGIIDKIMHDNV
jgi:8-oxo-dGTP diphosphatase